MLVPTVTTRVMSFFGAIVLLFCICASDVTGQTELQVVWGPDSSSAFGASLSRISDANLDGVADLLVTTASVPSAIAITLISGADGTVINTVPLGSVLLTALDGGVDIDGDLFPDFIASGSDGKGWVFSGATLQGFRQHDPISVGDALSEGRIIGDINIDGVPDYVFRASFDDPFSPKSDYVSVYSGKDGQLIRTHYGDPDEDYGCDVEPVFDFDMDGSDDYVVSSPFADIGKNPNSNEGVVQIVGGISGTVLIEHWGAPGDVFGCSVGDVGDHDGDGIRDIAVLRGPPSKARVISSTSGATIYESPPPSPNSFFRALRASDDFDGDGMMDVLVSQWQGSASGTARVLSFGSELKTVFQFDRPPQEGGTFQYPSDFVALGDLDGDGKGDWAISNWLAVEPSTGNAGNMRLLSGKALYHKQIAIEASASYRVDFELNAGVPRAGYQYILLVGATGTSPGVPVNQQVLPLNFDYLTEVSIVFANQGPFHNTLGVFDEYGNASSWFDGSLLPPSAVGAKLSFGYYSLGPGGVYVSTNPVELPVQ